MGFTLSDESLPPFPLFLFFLNVCVSYIQLTTGVGTAMCVPAYIQYMHELPYFLLSAVSVNIRAKCAATPALWVKWLCRARDLI